jgi:hypothetical protein
MRPWIHRGSHAWDLEAGNFLERGPNLLDSWREPYPH